MVVCINQPCGSIQFDVSAEEDVAQLSSAQKLVRTMLRPHFHCSPRPANLNNVMEHIHPTLAALWNEAEEWHLLASDHCDVYGFNVWNPAWLEESTEMVFGGPEGRKKWAKKQKNQVVNKRGYASGLESCASKGWVCCIAFSEFDYLVICTDIRKKEYGDLHHINTRGEKETYCCTMDDLLLHLVYFIREGKERQMKEKTPLFKGTMRPRTGLPRPLKMVRKAVVDAMMKLV